MLDVRKWGQIARTNGNVRAPEMIDRKKKRVSNETVERMDRWPG